MMLTTQQKEYKEVTILLAEDDLGHARLIEKNLRRAGITNEIVAVCDGESALNYVLAHAARSDGPSLAQLLVLLDLNLPVMDGYQVLQRMKADKSTKRVPVIVLTTTEDPREVARCYDLGCNVFVTKPVDYEHFSEAIRQLGLFLAVVTLPSLE
jgi:CheY-like chemotaxis protein